MNLLLLSRATLLITFGVAFSRNFATVSATMSKKALLLGAFEKGKGDNKSNLLTNSASKIDSDLSGKISRLVEL